MNVFFFFFSFFFLEYNECLGYTVINKNIRFNKLFEVSFDICSILKVNTCNVAASK
jgi:hypothetical protein